jgi:hypothetical protein
MTMKKYLPIVVIISLIIGVMSVTSCTCEKETLAKFPYGEIVSWKAQLDGSQIKDESNKLIDGQRAIEIRDEGGTVYWLVNLYLRVRNIGEEGVVVFHATCKVDTGRNKNEQTTSVSLKKNQEANVQFSFWVNADEIPMTYNQEYFNSIYTVQAVNLHDFVEEE